MTPGDLAVVAALTGLDDLHELARYPDPLSPEAAARTAGLPPLDLRAGRDYIAGWRRTGIWSSSRARAACWSGTTRPGRRSPTWPRCWTPRCWWWRRPGLGTLNHTALTLEALAARKLACAGVVVGQLARRSRPGRTVQPGRPAPWPVARWPGCSREGARAAGPDRFLAWPGGRCRRLGGTERTIARSRLSATMRTVMFQVLPCWRSTVQHLANQCAMRHTRKAAGQPLGGSRARSSWPPGGRTVARLSR